MYPNNHQLFVNIINSEKVIKKDQKKENPDEVVNFRSILFNIEQLLALVKTMSENEKEIFKDNKNAKIQKAIEKLMYPNNQQLFVNIINSEKVIKKDQKKEKNKKKEI